jgi:hypothetical protein
MDARLNKSARRISGADGMAARNLSLDYMFSWTYPSPHAIMSSGQIVISTNCGSLGCRSFAFTPRFFQPVPTLSASHGELETATHKEKKPILHNFGAM